MLKTVYFVRHGQSESNNQKLLGGWTEVNLSEVGVAQAHESAAFFKDSGIVFDYCFSSMLNRVRQTRDIILSDLDLKIPIEETWRLNESHTGIFSGVRYVNDDGTDFNDMVKEWIGGYSFALPPVPEDSPYNPRNNPKYANLPDKDELPLTESTEMLEKRLAVFWNNRFVPFLKNERYSSIFVVCHGNLIRSIMKLAENLSVEASMNRRFLPNCACLKYEYDDGNFVNREIIGVEKYIKDFQIDFVTKNFNKNMC